MIPDALLDRMADKFTIGDDCWDWKRPYGDGYGHIHWEVTATGRRRHRRAHVVLYELLVGPVPEGLELHHCCERPRCVRPAHLRPVTHRENLLLGRTTMPAREARKTHCVRGHPFDGANTYIDKHGWRICRACWTRAGGRGKQ